MNKRKVPSIFGAALLVTLLASAASAQVQRTFVSGAGNDQNPCTRAAPCRTFTRAISQTNAGGEVVVLDSAGYGAFSISKSVSIISPPGVYAGVTVFSGDGIDINAGGSDTVVLRGLTVNNQGSTGSGIIFNTGGTLRVDACAVRGFSTTYGVGFLGAGKLVVKDTQISDCDVGIFTGPSSGTAAATIDHVAVDACAFGVLMRADTAISQGVIRDSSISGSTIGIETLATSNGDALLDVERCLVVNGQTGLVTDSSSGRTSFMSISNCVVTRNLSAGFVINAGTSIGSRGNNTIGANGPGDTGTLTLFSGR